MRISTHSVRPTRHRSVDLMVGTALGCSLLVLAAPAAASDECGAAVGGVVTCTAAGSPYATGIQYTPGAGGLTMNFGAGANVDAVGAGVLISPPVFGSSPVTLNAQDAVIRATAAAGQVGLTALRVAGNDDIGIYVGEVQVSGVRATGIAALLGGDVQNGSRDILIDADVVTAAGEGSTGIYALNDSGDIDIHTGTITVTGDRAAGIYALSNFDVTIDVDTLTGHGAGGIEVDALGAASITVGTLTTTGDSADGISITSLGGGRSQVEFGTIRTEGEDAGAIDIETYGGEVIVRGGSVTALGGGGDYGSAVRVQQFNTLGSGPHTVTLEIANIVTGRTDDEGILYGDNGHGVRVDALADVNFEIGSISTHGVNARGAMIVAQGQITGAVDAVETRGDFATGLYLQTAGGITADFGSITTHGRYGLGVLAYTETGDIDISGRDIETFDDGAHGVLAASGYGDIRLDLGTVRTHGENAIGVWAQGAYQDGATIDLAIDAIETSGFGARGLLIQPQNAGMTVALGSVRTSGDSAGAIVVEQTEAGSLTLTADEVATTGADSSAILLDQGGDVTLDLGVVSTRGDNSRGIVVARDPELSGPRTVVVAADAVHTGHTDPDGVVTGFEADAIQIHNSGATTVNVGTVTTIGSLSDAIEIDAGGTGHVTLTATSPISATGAGSRGIAINGADGAVVAVADVSTEGSNAAAVTIRAHEDDGPATGGVTFTGGDITAKGENSLGLQIWAAGDVVATAGDVSTDGDTSRAVSVSSVNGAVNLRLGDIHTDGVSSSALGVGGYGDVTVLAGDIAALGNVSRGVGVSSLTGDVTLTLGDVETHGKSDSDAVTATLEAEDAVLRLTAGALQAFSGPTSPSSPGNSAMVIRNAGLSLIDIGSARTNSINAPVIDIDGAGTGEVDLDVAGVVASTQTRSEGLRVLSATDVAIRAGEVTTAGDDSTAVKIGMPDHAVTGDVSVAVGQLRTSGERSIGVDIETAGTVTLTLGSAVATGADGVAVQASGSTIDMTIATELRGTRVGADLDAAQSLTVNLAAGSSTSGAAFGLDLSSGTGTTLTNRGVLGSADGVALNVDGGAATINNFGTLEGRIDLTAVADTLTNAGTFRVRGTSDFGAGVDTLDNTGVVSLGDSATPLQARLQNLERFNNAGTIDLSNGVAGDVLTIDGVLNGLAGNQVLLDLDTRTTTVVADRLVVGSLEGLTHVELEVQGAGVIGDTGVTLVTSTAAQTGQELEVTTAGGFLDYDAVFDTVTREYRIVGAAADQAWEPTKVASGAQMQWRRGADVIAARFDDLRDSRAMGLRQGGGAEVWAQAFGGSGEVEGQRVIDGAAADLTHDVDVAGGQVGVDMVQAFGGGDLVLGAAGSLSETELTFQANGDTATFTGLGLGLYAQWSRGPLALGVMAKGDRYDLDYEWTSADLADEASGETWGVRVDAAWRIDAGPGWTIEPQASAWWSETRLDSITAEAGEVEFGDTNSLIGRAGVRVAHAMRLSNGAVVQPFAGLYGFNEFEGDNVSRIHLGSQTLEVADAAADLWGEAVFGANVGRGAIQGFVQGEAAFGEIRGLTARVGVRMNW
ncbi:autotransporter domain-containing protein [Brevundimonas sp.]|uniref:autotransporter domain-containing protein n=1 Tax=Brevundimonas sp. TaxID=1871086 RepID=UPI002FCB6AD7